MQVGARRRAGRLPQCEVGLRRRHPQLGHGGIRAAIAGRGLPGGPGHGVPTDRCAFPRLRDVSPREPACFQPTFQFRTGDPRSDQHLTGLRVQVVDLIHPPERDPDREPVRHVDPVHHGGAASEWHHRPATRAGQIEQRPDVLVAFGQRDSIHHRQFRGGPAALAEIDEGKATRTPHAHQVIDLDGTRQFGQLGGRDPPRAHRNGRKVDGRAGACRAHAALVEKDV